MAGWIPVREFVALEKVAQRALRAGDIAGIDKVNERLADVNMRLIVRDGRLYVEMITKEGAPDVRNPNHA